MKLEEFSGSRSRGDPNLNHHVIFTWVKTHKSCLKIYVVSDTGLE